MQTFNSRTSRIFVNFDVTLAWYTNLPIVKWFFDSDLNFNDVGVTTYEFAMHGVSFYPSRYINVPLFGYVNYTIS